MTILLYYIYIYIMPNLTNQGIVQYWPKSALPMKKGDHFTTPYSINPLKWFASK